MALILVVNAGSTSLKLRLVGADETSTELRELPKGSEDIDAVAHRVVHGGSRFREPVQIDASVKKEIQELEEIAPLHNAPALAAIEVAQEVLPTRPHIAVFDTAFHGTMPPEATTYAVPEQWREEWGIRRYGFHGLSVAWCVERACEYLGRPRDGLRLVVCHLGGGCSLTAVRDGCSVDTTMGFSPLEGIPMTSRSGSVDPGALLFLLRSRGLDVEALDHALNFDSGINALADGSGMVEIERRAMEGDTKANLALNVFVHRVAGAVAAMGTACGGLDAVVFTAGIGENSALVRERVCEPLRFLGVGLDRDRNGSVEGDCDVADDDSRVRVLVVRAREEVVAAREARKLL